MSAPESVTRMLVDHGRTVRLAVSGTSMTPMLVEPMTLDVIGLQSRAPRIGDVLVFRLGDAWIAHRVVARRQGRYITSGDAHPDVLEVVPPVDVLGRVCAVWSDASAAATRIDDPRHRMMGWLYARCRRLRLLKYRIENAARRARSSISGGVT